MTSFIDHYELALADVSAGQRVPIPLFPVGNWTSAKYKELPLTRELADELIAGFESGVLGTEPVLDSSGSHDTAAPAAGWFKRLYVAPTKDGGEMLFGEAELTELGAKMLNDGLYKYSSIEIGPVVDNATGAKTERVFRSATLTNVPVLRILPPILEAGDVIAASEPVEIALSEITAAETKSEGEAGRFPAEAYAYVPDPELPSTWKLRLWRTPDGGPDAGIVGAAIAALGKGFRGQRVDIPAADLPAVKAKVRAAWRKANPDRDISEMPEVIRASDTDPSADDRGLSAPAGSDAIASGKAAEGAPVLSTDDHAMKGVPMKSVIAALKLAEDASEADVLAAVTRLAEHDAAETKRADAAEAKLAENEKAERTRAFEARLAEAMKPDEKGRLKVLPGEREAFVKLMERDEKAASEFLEARIAGPAVLVLGETGSGAEGDEGAYENPSVELAEKGKARAAKDGISWVKASRLVLAEDPDLQKRYDLWRANAKEA